MQIDLTRPARWGTQKFRVMKLTAIFLTITALQVCANGVAQGVTLSLKEVSIKVAFTEIRKQTGYDFFFDDALLKDAKKVTIEAKNASLTNVLDQCFRSQPFSYKITGSIVTVQPKTYSDLSTNETADASFPIDIKGKVVNEKGEPVEGVTVTAKGTNRFTKTNAAGEFILKAIDKGAVLEFTHVSMETFELEVQGNTELSITLKTKTTALSEVLVTINTGYQQTNKERFIGAFSQLSNEAYERRAGMDIIGRLDGTVTGVLFDKKAGGDVGQLRSIQVRGVSTLNLSQSPSQAPLVIVDNFPFKQDLNTINPNDIENITVLKDAVAASIWGAQAGNGVIVITTKKSKYKQPFRVSASSNITIQEKPNQYYYPQMAVSDFVDAEIMFFNNGVYDARLANTSTWPVISPVVETLLQRKKGKISPADSTIQINSFKQLDLRRDLDNYVYRPGISQQHYINLSGGSNIFNYSFSGGYNRNLNNVKNSRPDDQYTLTTTSGFRPIKNLEITSSIKYTHTKQLGVNFFLPAPIYPYAQLADAEGHPVALPSRYRIAYLDTAGSGNLLDWKLRPLEEPRLADKQNTIQFIMLNFAVSYRFTKWLEGFVSYQYSNQTANNRNVNSIQTFFTRNLINQYTNLSQTDPNKRNPLPIGGILETLQSQTTSKNARAQLNFSKSLAIRHQVTALVAADISQTKNTGNQNRFYGYDDNVGSYNSNVNYLTAFPLYGTTNNQQIPNGTNVFPELNNRFVSFTGNASYSYNDRYTAYASARKDGSNVFGVNSNRKWKPLWSTGISWDISKEAFYKIKFLSSLRLRASYGFSGNPGNATGLPTIIYGSTFSSIANLNYAAPSDPPNPNLRWEKVKTINIGLDFVLFEGRLAGGIDAWKKRSTDLIAGTPLAPSTGNLSFTTNIAALKGSGFELNLSSLNTSGVIKWQTGFGLSYAKTVVSKFYSINNHGTDRFKTYGLNPVEGKIVYGLGSYKWEGLDPLTGDPRGYFNKQISTDYIAILNDSIDNQIFHGSAIPLYQGNILNSFIWKHFTLSANVTYRLDFYFRRPTINYGDLINGWQGHKDYALRWKQPGDERRTNVPSIVFSPNSYRDQFYQYSEVNVLRGDNIRLQDIRLQYDFIPNLTKDAIKSIKVFLYANDLNIILWRKNKADLDPDFTKEINFITPVPKSWTVGVNVDF
jgi:TonB-linked SusC/RagA family outer membrane protein